MNITEAIVKTAFITTSVTRSNIVSLLVTGELEICDNCGFTLKPDTISEVCENEWADEMAAKEEEASWYRAELASRY